MAIVEEREFPELNAEEEPANSSSINISANLLFNKWGSKPAARWIEKNPDSVGWDDMGGMLCKFELTVSSDPKENELETEPGFIILWIN